MRISLLLPCYNEEKSIVASLESCLHQTRLADEVIVVDDSSTDRTPELLASFGNRITVVRTPRNMGNKSHAQQYGLQFVSGEIFITTDADTLLKEDFIEKIEKSFSSPNVAAVGGYVKSLQKNWITRHRAFEYAIGQNLHKLAQSRINFMFVIPGAAGAFRTEVFKRYLTFDHDTITEDLDFTYKLHKLGFQVRYNMNAVVYTQDPSSLSSYIKQIRRWYAGGWQNLLKHYDIAFRPIQALELSLMYVEGLVFSILVAVVPALNVRFALKLMLPYLLLLFAFSGFAAYKEKRPDILLAAFPYIFLMYINAYVFMEQFFKEFLFQKRDLVWVTPDRTVL